MAARDDAALRHLELLTEMRATNASVKSLAESIGTGFERMEARALETSAIDSAARMKNDGNGLPTNWVNIAGVVVAVAIGLGGLFSAFISPMQKDINTLEDADEKLEDRFETKTKESTRALWERANSAQGQIDDLRSRFDSTSCKLKE